jgi:hypothetical protein
MHGLWQTLVMAAPGSAAAEPLLACPLAPDSVRRCSGMSCPGTGKPQGRRWGQRCSEAHKA